MKNDKSTDDEARLDKALRAGLPSARDPLFRIAVLERRERRLLHRRVATTISVGATVSVMGSLVLASLADANADVISAWLSKDVERVAVSLTILASACFTFAAAWLTAADRMLTFLRAGRRWLWI